MGMKLCLKSRQLARVATYLLVVVLLLTPRPFYSGSYFPGKRDFGNSTRTSTLQHRYEYRGSRGPQAVSTHYSAELGPK